MIRFLKHRFRLIANIFHLFKIICFLFKYKLSFFFKSQKRIDYSNSFAPYIYDQSKISELINGLEHKDQDLIIKILNKIKIILNNNVIPNTWLFDKQDQIGYKAYFNFYNKSDKSIDYFKKQVDISNLYYIPITLDELKIEKDYSKDIIDCGAFIGDSAYTFSNKLPLSQIYAFEPNEYNYNSLKNTINYFDKNKTIIPIKKGLSKTSGISYITNEGSGSTIGIGKEKIELTNIDQFVKENNLNPGIIKRDIEGAEYDSLLGTVKTIKKFKPILFVSIYHNGRDFFEIKSLIKKINPKYKFKIAKWADLPPVPITEIILICY